MLSLLFLLLSFLEELMLHEEVIVDWASIERQVNDPKLLELLQMDFVYGVSFLLTYKFQIYNYILYRVFHRTLVGEQGQETYYSVTCILQKSPSGFRKQSTKRDKTSTV